MKGPFLLLLLILTLDIASAIKCRCTVEDNPEKTCDNCLLCYTKKGLQSTTPDNKCIVEDQFEEIKKRKTEESQILAELAQRTMKSQAPQCNEEDGTVTCLCVRDNCNEANIVPKRSNKNKRQSNLGREKGATARIARTATGLKCHCTDEKTKKRKQESCEGCLVCGKARSDEDGKSQLGELCIDQTMFDEQKAKDKPDNPEEFKLVNKAMQTKNETCKTKGRSKVCFCTKDLCNDAKTMPEIAKSIASTKSAGVVAFVLTTAMAVNQGISG